MPLRGFISAARGVPSAQGDRPRWPGAVAGCGDQRALRQWSAGGQVKAESQRDRLEAGHAEVRPDPWLFVGLITSAW